MSMDKLLEVPAFDEFGKPNTRIIPRMSASVFEKTAGSLPAEVKDYLERLEPDPQFLYLLVVALGAADFWGSNVNGDAFFEKDLLGNQTPMEAGRNPPPYSGVPLPRYNTFCCAHVFKHHVNKDPLNSFGKVELPVYDKAMHRVLLIVSVDKKKAPDIVSDIDKNGSVVWSMGTKVPFDECSICHHKSKTVSEYCKHLKTAMNQTWENGHKVYAINSMPRFFDISRVLIPADKTAMTLMKVASCDAPMSTIGDDGTGCGAYSRCHRAIPSAEIAERVKVAQAKIAGTKKGEIKKEVPVHAIDADNDLSGNAAEEKLKRLKGIGERIRKMAQAEPNLPAATLEKLGEFPLHQALSSMASLGIVAKPSEFARLVITKFAQQKLGNKTISFVDPGAVNTEAIGLLIPFIAERSALSPWIDARMERPSQLMKTAEASLPVTFVTLYEQYLDSLVKWDPAVSCRTIVKHAHLLPETRTASVEEMFHAMLGSGLTKVSGLKTDAALAGTGLVSSYLAAAHEKIKEERKGEQLNPVQKLVSKHPLPIGAATAVAAVLGAHKLGLSKLK